MVCHPVSNQGGGTDGKGMADFLLSPFFLNNLWKQSGTRIFIQLDIAAAS
jgi:hypothetical protein